jgi:transposase
VSETLRHALNALAVAVPAWLRAHADLAWVERYAKRLEQYRLPQAEGERQALSMTIGQDGYRLLELVYDPAAPHTLRQLSAVETLRQVWVQQYYRCTDPDAPVLRLRTAGELPPTGQIISSPYDPEARYKTKGATSWVGYTVQCDSFSRNQAAMAGG